MNQVKIMVDGKERTITSLGEIDMGNPMTEKMLEMMLLAGDKAKAGCVIRVPSGEPLTGRGLDIARESFEEYFSDSYLEDDTEK